MIMMTQSNHQLWLEYIAAVRTQNSLLQKEVFNKIVTNKTKLLIENNETDKIEYFIVSTLKPALSKLDVEFVEVNNTFKLRFMSKQNNEMILTFVFSCISDKCIFDHVENEMLDGDINEVNDADVKYLGNIFSNAINDDTTLPFIQHEDIIVDYLTPSLN